MSFWIKFSINTAMSVVVTLLQSATTTEAHKAKIVTFISAGQDLVNNW